jgi:hypothetical protein
MTDDEILNLVRLGVKGRIKDVEMYTRRLARKYRFEKPELSAALFNLAGPGNILRDNEPLSTEAQ